MRGNEPLFERKALLRKLVAKTDILFSESFEADGAAMFKQVCNMVRRLQGPRKSLQFRPRQRLDQDDVPAARDAADHRLHA